MAELSRGVLELRMKFGVEELGCGGAENEVWRS